MTLINVLDLLLYFLKELLFVLLFTSVRENPENLRNKARNRVKINAGESRTIDTEPKEAEDVFDYIKMTELEGKSFPTTHSEMIIDDNPQNEHKL